MDEGLRERLTRQGEEALGKLAEELAGNPIVTAALQRLEAIEDTLDRVEERIGALPVAESGDERILERLEEVVRDIAALREALVPADQPVPRAQERLSVSD